MTTSSPEPQTPGQTTATNDLIPLINTNLTSICALYLSTSSISITALGAAIAAVLSITRILIIHRCKTDYTAPEPTRQRRS